MRKFVIHTLKGDTSIIEVECERITGREDPSVMWLPAGEYTVKITAPQSLLTKKVVGKETTLEPTIYYSHGVFDSEEAAVTASHLLMRKTIELRAMKSKTAFKEEDVTAEIEKIKVVKL